MHLATVCANIQFGLQGKAKAEKLPLRKDANNYVCDKLRMQITAIQAC